MPTWKTDAKHSTSASMTESHLAPDWNDRSLARTAHYSTKRAPSANGKMASIVPKVKCFTRVHHLLLLLLPLRKAIRSSSHRQRRPALSIRRFRRRRTTVSSTTAPLRRRQCTASCSPTSDSRVRHSVRWMPDAVCTVSVDPATTSIRESDRLSSVHPSSWIKLEKKHHHHKKFYFKVSNFGISKVIDYITNRWNWIHAFAYFVHQYSNEMSRKAYFLSIETTKQLNTRFNIFESNFLTFSLWFLTRYDNRDNC